MITIRPATTNDAAAICKVHVTSIREVCAADYTELQIQAWTALKTPQGYVDAMEAGQEMFVALEHERIVGFGSIDISKAVIQAIYVHPNALGKGVGRALLSKLEERASQSKLSELTLPSSLTARGFYEKSGYKAGKESFHMLSGGVQLECVPMHKKLLDM